MSCAPDVCLNARMAFSSCLKCHPWTLYHNLNHPFRSPQASKPVTIISFPFSRIFSGLSSVPLSPDFTQTQLLDTLRCEEDETSAFRLFQWASKQPNFVLALTVYEEILKKLGDIGSFDSVREVLDDMKHSKVEVSKGIFVILINSYAKFKLYEEAVGVLDVMETEFGVKAGTQTYNFLLNVLVDGNKLILVENVLSKMLNNTVELDVSTFNTLIKALCKANQTRSAILLMEEMLNHGLSPDEKTLHVMINGFCKTGRVEEALMFIIQEMENKGFYPDQFTFNSLIIGLCKVGHVDHAMEILDLILQEGFNPDISTYDILIDLLCTKGKLDEALKILKHMELSNCARNVTAYNKLIHCFCKIKKTEKAEKIFDQMKLKGMARNLVTYNTLIDGLCKSNRVDDASQLMEQMKTEGLKPDKFTYNPFITYFCRVGDIKKAESILRTMTSNGCELNVVTYGALIQGNCIVGRTEVAKRLLKAIQMKGMILSPEAYNPIIKALFKRKKVEEALRLFREMEEESDLPPDGISYKIVFRGLCSGKGTVGEAVDFALEMTEKGYLPELSAFNMLAEKLCALNMEETLAKLMYNIMAKAKVSDNEVAVITGFLKIGKFSDSLEKFGRVLFRRGINSRRKSRKGYF